MTIGPGSTEIEIKDGVVILRDGKKEIVLNNDSIHFMQRYLERYRKCMEEFYAKIP